MARQPPPDRPRGAPYLVDGPDLARRPPLLCGLVQHPPTADRDRGVLNAVVAPDENGAGFVVAAARNGVIGEPLLERFALHPDAVRALDARRRHDSTEAVRSAAVSERPGELLDAGECGWPIAH